LTSTDELRKQYLTISRRVASGTSGSSVTRLRPDLRLPAWLLAIGSAFTLLTACTSVANQTNTSTFSPAPPRAGYGSVYIGRPFGPNTSIFSLPVHLDGK